MNQQNPDLDQVIGEGDRNTYQPQQNTQGQGQPNYNPGQQQHYQPHNNYGGYQRNQPNIDELSQLFNPNRSGSSSFNFNPNVELLNKLIEEIKKTMANNNTGTNNVGIISYADQQNGNNGFIITKKVPIAGNNATKTMSVVFVPLLLESLSKPTSPFIEFNRTFQWMGKNIKERFPIFGATGRLRPSNNNGDIKVISDIKNSVVSYFESDPTVNADSIFQAEVLIVPSSIDLRDANNLSISITNTIHYVVLAERLIDTTIVGMSKQSLTNRKASDITKSYSSGFKLEVESFINPGETETEFGVTYAKDFELVTKGKIETRGYNPLNVYDNTNNLEVAFAAVSGTLSIQKDEVRMDPHTRVFQGIRPVIHITNTNVFNGKYEAHFGENSFVSIFLGLTSCYSWLQNPKIMKVFEHSGRPQNRKANIGNLGLYYDASTGQTPLNPQQFKVTQLITDLGSVNENSDPIIPLSNIYAKTFIKPARITLDITYGDPMFFLLKYLLLDTPEHMGVVLHNLDNFYQTIQDGKPVNNVFTQIWTKLGKPSMTIHSQQGKQMSINILLGHYFDKNGELRDIRHYNEVLNLLGETAVKNDPQLLAIFERVNHPGYYSDNLLNMWYEILTTQLLANTDNTSFHGSPNTCHITGIGKRVYINPMFLACIDQANYMCNLVIPDNSMSMDDLLMSSNGMFYNFDDNIGDKIGTPQSYQSRDRGYTNSPFANNFSGDRLFR